MFRQYVVYVDWKDGVIDQNVKFNVIVIEFVDEWWNRKKENVKSKWIFILFILIKLMNFVYC